MSAAYLDTETLRKLARVSDSPELDTDTFDAGLQTLDDIFDATMVLARITTRGARKHLVRRAHFLLMTRVIHPDKDPDTRDDATARALDLLVR